MFKRRERTKSRSQLLCFQWIYERTGARRALFRLRTLVEARSAPEPRSLGPATASFKSADQRGAVAIDRGRRPRPSTRRRRRGSPRRRRPCAMPAARPACDVAQVVADVDAVARARRRAGAPLRAAAPGCGLACGVVSPHDQRRGAAAQARARAISGSAKRVALLVTMPHGSAGALERVEHRQHAVEDPRLARHARLVAGEELVAQRVVAGVVRARCRTRRRPCRARRRPPSAAAPRTAAAPGRARRASRCRRRPGRARCRSACRRGRTARRAQRQRERSCRLAAGDEVVDARVAGQPVALASAGCIACPRVAAGSSAGGAAPAAPARSAGGSLRVLVRALRQQLQHVLGADDREQRTPSGCG